MEKCNFSLNINNNKNRKFNFSWHYLGMEGQIKI